MSETSISVVIVNFNSGEYLADCVRAVLASSIRVEVYVVDNASTDNSLFAMRKAVGEDLRVTVIENYSNRGFAAGNNQALRKIVRGEYVLILNPDCVVEPDTLEKTAAIMDQRPEVGLAGVLIHNQDGTEQKGCRRKVPTPWRTFVRVMGLPKLFPEHPWFSGFEGDTEPLAPAPVTVDAISGSFMFVRRAAVARVGLMDEAYFLHCEDLDWCMRFREHGYPVLFISSISVVHYKGVCGRSRPVRVSWYMHKGMVRFYRKFLRRRYPLPMMWGVVAAVWVRFGAMAMIVSMRRYFGHRAEPTSTPALNMVREHRRKGAGGAGRSIIVTGARSQIGAFLIGKLLAEGFHVYLLGREMTGEWRKDPGVTWIRADLQDLQLVLPSFMATQTLIHLAPVWLLPAHVESFAGVGIKRIIAFSSTSRFTKQQSSDPAERETAQRLATVEAELASACARWEVRWTVFRPTLIYGCGLDQNVAAIARFAGKFRFFPIAGRGRGLRQPVHAEDLADACLAAMEAPVSFGKAYDLSGGQALSYVEMVREIFNALGRRPRIVHLPLPLLRKVLRVVQFLPRYRQATGAMLERMERDLCFDSAAARENLGWRPRRFLGARVPPAPERQTALAAARGPALLVSGANGFIGAAFCQRALWEGDRVRALVRRHARLAQPEPALERMTVPDLAQPEARWPAAFEGVDVIVHLAGLAIETATGPAGRAWEYYRQLNQQATQRLAQAAAQAGVKRFLYVSSVKVHGEMTAQGQAFSEPSPFQPRGAYAETKLGAERVLRRIEAESGMEVVIVRPPLVYGPGVKVNFLRLLRLVERGFPLPVGGVKNQRSFVFVENLVDLLWRCTRAPEAAGEDFLIADGCDLSIGDVIRRMAHGLGREPRIFKVSDWMMRLAAQMGGEHGTVQRLCESLVVDIGKAQRVLGWRPPFSVDEGFASTTAWYLERISAVREGPRPGRILPYAARPIEARRASA